MPRLRYFLDLVLVLAFAAVFIEFVGFEMAILAAAIGRPFLASGSSQILR